MDGGPASVAAGRGGGLGTQRPCRSQPARPGSAGALWQSSAVGSEPALHRWLAASAL